MIGLWPAEVDSIDRVARLARVRMPGLTDGATELPQAEFCNPIGDKSEHTEIRIKPGDRVWVQFIGGDTRYPVIVGYRPRQLDNDMDWRRFEHQNIELAADTEIAQNAGTKIGLDAGTQIHQQAGDTIDLVAGREISLDAESRVHVTAPGVRIDASLVTVKGSLTVGAGATGTFTTPTGVVVMVEKGIVTNIF